MENYTVHREHTQKTYNFSNSHFKYPMVSFALKGHKNSLFGFDTNLPLVCLHLTQSKMRIADMS
jgi:hypothetical protein